MKCRIAVVQFKTELYNPDINIDRMREFVKEAAGEQADVIVFPEDFITGPVRERLDLVDAEGLYVHLFRECARENGIDIAAGSIIEKIEGTIFNTSYYIDRKGEILSRYSKVHLWITERQFVTPGNRIEPFKTAYGMVGLSICWDLAFPEVYRTYAVKGAEIVFNASFWGYEDAGEKLCYIHI